MIIPGCIEILTNKMTCIPQTENLKAYESFKKIIESKGYHISIIHRPDLRISNELAGKYEIWFEGNWFDTKAGTGETLEEAVKNARPSIQKAIKNWAKPGKLNDISYNSKKN